MLKYNIGEKKIETNRKHAGWKRRESEREREKKRKSVKKKRERNRECREETERELETIANSSHTSSIGQCSIF
jgi:hypothetical protein